MATEKAELSREYLEEALSIARRTLPGWAFAVILREARARAGGRVSALRRKEARESEQNGSGTPELSAEPKAVAKQDATPTNVQTLIFSKGNFSESQAVAWATKHDYGADKVDETSDSFRLRQRPPAAFESGSFRTIELTEGVQAVIGKPKNETTATRKGLAQGDTGGVHCHNLKRPLEATDIDGAHAHAFLMPDGSIAVTEYDGEHQHSLAAGASETGDGDRPHTHRLLFGGIGAELQTRSDGPHTHEALVDVTANDGAHVHELELPTGEVITSLTPAEFYEHRRKRILAGKERSEMMEAAAHVEEVQPEPPTVAFVGSHDSALDRARREPLTGSAGAIFNDRYLKPLGLTRDSALVVNINGDIEAVRKRLDEAKPQAVIALGRDARDALGKLADCMLPHPHVLTRRDDTGEVARKLRVIAKRLATKAEGGYIPSVVVPIAKADDERRIVYGVVLDPYAVDAHDEHVPPRVIESTAHEWLSSSRLIDVEHTQLAKAVPVESHIVHYPTALDRERAFTGQPHQAYQMRFGADIVHSGAWILGTKLGDAEWGAVKDGRINAYSIGGFSVKVPMTAAEMPQVEFIDLGG